MSLDTKYRPLRLSEVVGQEATVKILREIVKSGSGFRQSYIFAGAYGSGKTTMGRILARSLLCDAPTDEGDFCGTCDTCRAFDQGNPETFTEVDAATNSRKEDMKQIVETLQYSSFTGKRRIYLFDEAHQLSKDALDAILKPMEDNVPGTPDKKLVCIFCTTEIERMRPTILSRCATAFVIRTPETEQIVSRLEYVCQQEGLEYDRDALALIVESCESHIRDTLKTVEGTSLLGPINQQNVSTYLRLDTAPKYFELIHALGGPDRKAVLDIARDLYAVTSPSVIYDKITEYAMLAYQVSLGVGNIPVYLNADTVRAAHARHGNFLFTLAGYLSSRPPRPTISMLNCDLMHLHSVRLGSVETIPALGTPLYTTSGTPPPAPVSPNSPQDVSDPDDSPGMMPSVSSSKSITMPAIARKRPTARTEAPNANPSLSDPRDTFLQVLVGFKNQTQGSR